MTWQETMAKEIESEFGPPFLPEGFVQAKILIYPDETILKIRIGDRDIDFDSLGKDVGSGMNLGTGVEWGIPKRKKPKSSSS